MTEDFELRGRMTAQMVGAVLGSNPNMTREDAMRRMVRDWHGAEVEGAGNMATAYAVNSIPGALIEYTMETGSKVAPGGLQAVDHWGAASVNGLISIFGCIIVICPFGLRAAEAPVKFPTMDEKPYYFDRAQFALLATGRAWCDVYQWTPAGTQLDRIAACSKWKRKNLPKLAKFYAEFEDERQQDNAIPHLEPKRKIVDTPQAHRIKEEYLEILENIHNAEARKAELIAEMVRLSDSKDADFAGLKLTLVKRVGSISYAKAFKVIAPTADLEPYRGKPSESWQVKE